MEIQKPNVSRLESVWINILLTKKGKCTPFMGTEACAGVLPLSTDITNKRAREYILLRDIDDLPRVTQFVGIEQYNMILNYFKGLFDRFAGG